MAPNFLEQCFSNISMLKRPLVSLLEYRFLGPTSKDSDSVGLGWGLRFCVSKRLPVDSAVAGPG